MSNYPKWPSEEHFGRGFPADKFLFWGASLVLFIYCETSSVKSLDIEDMKLVDEKCCNIPGL